MNKIKDMTQSEVERYIDCIFHIHNFIGDVDEENEISLTKLAIFDPNDAFLFEPTDYIITVSKLWSDEVIYKASTIDNPDLTFEEICRVCNLKTSLF